jgi:hypothetical protein
MKISSLVSLARQLHLTTDAYRMNAALALAIIMVATRVIKDKWFERQYRRRARVDGAIRMSEPSKTQSLSHAFRES